MREWKLISWNVNGIRAAHKKGFLDWFAAAQPDLLCLQETKAQPEQLPPELLAQPGYHCYYDSAERKGYSGVAVWTREEPLSVQHGLGVPDFDAEGRSLLLHFPGWSLLNCYFPNGQQSQERLDFKMAFYEKVLQLAQETPRLVICGDVNTAHRPIDLARPKENETVSGFLPIERDWIDRLLAAGYLDSFRVFHEEGEQYSWWSMRTRARERNAGWRLDYFFVPESMQQNLRAASILQEVQGSDHCPVELILALD